MIPFRGKSSSIQQLSATFEPSGVQIAVTTLQGGRREAGRGQGAPLAGETVREGGVVPPQMNSLLAVVSTRPAGSGCLSVVAQETRCVRCPLSLSLPSSREDTMGARRVPKRRWPRIAAVALGLAGGCLSGALPPSVPPGWTVHFHQDTPYVSQREAERQLRERYHIEDTGAERFSPSVTAGATRA